MSDQNKKEHEAMELWAHWKAAEARHAVRRDLPPEPKIPEAVKKAAEIAYGWKFN